MRGVGGYQTASARTVGLVGRISRAVCEETRVFGLRGRPPPAWLAAILEDEDLAGWSVLLGTSGLSWTGPHLAEPPPKPLSSQEVLALNTHVPELQPLPHELHSP